MRKMEFRAENLGTGYMDITILVKQVYWYISRVSGERLQDHWCSGFLFINACHLNIFAVLKYNVEIFQKPYLISCSTM